MVDDHCCLYSPVFVATVAHNYVKQISPPSLMPRQCYSHLPHPKQVGTQNDVLRQAKPGTYHRSSRRCLHTHCFRTNKTEKGNKRRTSYGDLSRDVYPETSSMRWCWLPDLAWTRYGNTMFGSYLFRCFSAKLGRGSILPKHQPSVIFIKSYKL